jgi:hypothetical protein
VIVDSGRSTTRGDENRNHRGNVNLE